MPPLPRWDGIERRVVSVSTIIHAWQTDRRRSDQRTRRHFLAFAFLYPMFAGAAGLMLADLLHLGLRIVVDYVFRGGFMR